MKKQVILLSSSIGLLACCSPAYAQFIPGGVDSAGLSYLVPDMLVWYNTNQLPGNFFPGYVTNGPIYNLNDQFGNTEVGNANWDANVSELGDGTFLVTCPTMADDGSWNSSTNAECKGVQGPGYSCGRGANERCIVIFQPTSGGAPQIGDTYYDDFGKPYRLHKGLRQRNSNPAHVGGDKRIGGTNFMTEAFCALWYCGLWFGVDYFNSDGRFSTNLPLYATGLTLSVTLTLTWALLGQLMTCPWASSRPSP